MPNYTQKATAAQRQLAKYGQSITLNVITTGAYDADLGLAPVTSIPESRKAVLLDFDRINFGETAEFGTLIRAGDRRCLLDAKGTRPKVNDTVTVDDGTYPIIDIKRLSPAGIDVLYDMLIRK